MDPKERIVTSLPLRELWDANGLVEADFRDHLTFTQVRDLLPSGGVTFVVVEIGKPIRWVPMRETFSFWSTDVRVRVADPSGFRLA